MNIEGFLTVLSWIWVVCWSLGFIAVIGIYCSLSKFQRSVAEFKFHTGGFFAFIAAVAWLVTR